MSAVTLPPAVAAGDEELVQGHLAGNADATAELYRRYHPRLVTFATARYQDRSFALEIGHDALLRAFDNLGSFDQTRPLWPWLRTVASNMAVDRFRAQRRALEKTARDEPTAADHSEEIVERGLVRMAMVGLPERQRRALALSYVEGWGADEAARRLGVTRNAFDQLLFRARANLRKAYLALEPDALARVRLAVFPLLIDLLRRARLRALPAMEVATVTQSVAAALVVPMLVSGALAPSHVRADVQTVQAAVRPAVVRTDNARAQLTARQASRLRERPAATAAIRASQRSTHQRSGDHEGAGEPHGQEAATEINLRPEMTAERDGDHMHRKTKVEPTGSDGTSWEHESEAECNATVRRAMCDAQYTAADTAASVLDRAPEQ